MSLKGVRIIAYHSVGGRPEDHPMAIRVPVDRFEEEMAELKISGYNTLTISELVETRIHPADEKCIAITFDDGYKDNVTTAAVILKKLDLRATFFITTSCIDGESQKVWADGSPRQYMNWEDIIDLSNMGFEIGSHMVHHINLMALDDRELLGELQISKDIIASHIAKPVNVLSFPYGKLNKNVINMARKTGYMAGCSVFAGQNDADTDPYALRRTEIDGYDTIKDFEDKLCGFYD